MQIKSLRKPVDWAIELLTTLSKAMKAKRSKQSTQGQRIRPSRSMPVINPHAAGVDISPNGHAVCVPEDSVPAGESPVREFGAFTQQLDNMVEWLGSCGVKTVAMESTGKYWIAPFERLEAAGFEVVLVNAHDLKHVPGRKSDILDCQWIQRLHSYGLLSGSFRPPEDIRRMRTLLRHRSNLVVQCGQEVQHMQGALDEMNIHLHRVVSDLDGETGFRIMDAILAGERNPDKLVELRDERIRKSTVEEMKEALHGFWQEEQIFVLRQARETHRWLQRQIEECDVELQKVVQRVKSNPVSIPPEQAPPNPEGKVGTKKKKNAGGNAPKPDFTAELTRICGIDLTQVVGLNVLSVLMLVSELGVDMNRWRSAKAFASWLGLCPGSKISGGKRLSSRTRPVANRVSILLRSLAPTIGRTDTWLGHFHRRMKARLGPAGANTATGHKLAAIIYHLLKYKEPYIDVDCLLYEAKFRCSRLTRLRKQAQELGFQLVETPQLA
jgi:transposase